MFEHILDYYSHCIFQLEKRGNRYRWLRNEALLYFMYTDWDSHPDHIYSESYWERNL